MPWRPGWTNKFIYLFILSGLQKLEQWVKKCNELRPSLFAVACFLPGRAKDLSALPRSTKSVEMLSDTIRTYSIQNHITVGHMYQFTLDMSMQTQSGSGDTG